LKALILQRDAAQLDTAASIFKMIYKDSMK